MGCEKSSRMGLVQSHQVGGLLLKGKRLQIVSKTVGLGLSLGVFRKSHFLSFLEEVLLGVFLKEGEVQT